MLGFDIYNPLEVRPEYIADFGKKKGKKVDYAIFKDSIPVMFFEAKSVNEKLLNHDAQLCRYFNFTKDVSVGIITKYPDLKKRNFRVMIKKLTSGRQISYYSPAHSRIGEGYPGLVKQNCGSLGIC